MSTPNSSKGDELGQDAGRPTSGSAEQSPPDSNAGTSAPKPTADCPPPKSDGDSSYFEKLLAYIPADCVAGYLAVDAIIKQSLADMPLWVYWAVFGAMLFLTPLYVFYRPIQSYAIKSDSKKFRGATAFVAFAVWVFALGGPFAVTFPWYKPVYGAVLLIITTLIIPVAENIVNRMNPPLD